MYMCALPLSALENMREQRRTSPLTSSHASVLTSVDTMGVAVLLTSCIVQNTNDDGMSKFALAAPAGKNKEKVHIASCWTQIMKVAGHIYIHTRAVSIRVLLQILKKIIVSACRVVNRYRAQRCDLNCRYPVRRSNGHRRG